MEDPVATPTLLRNAHDGGLAAQLLTDASRRRLAFYLDYDGTLAPIVDQPDRAIISEETREVLRELAAAYPVALVSGRSNEKLRDFLQLDGAYLAGSHGVHICGPSGVPLDGPDPEALVGSCALSSLREAHRELDAALSAIDGYLTEDNVYCITAHYRMVDPSLHEHVRETVANVLRRHPALQHKEGKMVHELRPAIKWDKGKAVEWLQRMLSSRAEPAEPAAAAAAPTAAAGEGGGGGEGAESGGAATGDEGGGGEGGGGEGGGSGPGRELLAVYLGDDVADEDAFRAAKRLGGVGIKVAEGAVASDATAATWKIAQPQVVQLLRSFLSPPGARGVRKRRADEVS